jgi:hypothetical protein
MMAELHFDHQDAMMTALGSEDGKAAGKDIKSFAGNVIHMMFATVDV